MRNGIKRAANRAGIAGLVSLAAACGGGGGSSNDNVPPAPASALATPLGVADAGAPTNAVSLASAADVERELSISGVVVAGTEEESTAETIKHLQGPHTLHQWAAARPISVATPAAAGAPAVQPAATTTPCNGGGTVESSSSSVIYNFNFFDTNQTATAYTSTDSSCVQTGSEASGISNSLTVNGLVQNGETGASVSAPGYYFSTYGNGSTATTTHYTVTNTGTTTYDVTQDLLISYQQDTTSTEQDTRNVSNVTTDETIPNNVTETTNFGSPSTPYRVAFMSNNTATVAGPYSYMGNGSDCSGGMVTVATPVALTQGTGGPVAGTVLLTSGSASASVVFGADGSAAVTFGDGSTASLTATQVQTISDCMVVVE